MKKILSIILTVVLVVSLVVTSLVTNASATDKTLLIDWDANATSQGYYEGGWTTDTSTDGYINLTGAKSGRFYQSWGWLNKIKKYGGLSFTAYCAEGSANTNLQLMFGSGVNNAVAYLTSTPQEFNFTYADFGFESLSDMSGDFGFYSLTPYSTDEPNADVYISDIYVYAADGEGEITTVPTETETTTAAPVVAGITFDDNDMSFVTTVGTASSAEIANGALKVGMNQWDSDLTVSNYARIEIDTTGLKDLKFDAWQSDGSGWNGTDKGSHYGLEIDGVVYWDTPYDSGQINSRSAKTISVVDVKYYSLVDNSFSATGTYDVEKKITADDIKNIDAICIRPGNHYNAQYANIDNITAAKPGSASVSTPADAISTLDESSIRLSNGGGIRFYTTYDASKVTGTVEEIGTLIGPKDLIGDELTIEDVTADNALTVEFDLTQGLYSENTIVGSIVNIKESNAYNVQTGNLNRKFTARAYIKVDGVYYYSATTSTRCVSEIADAFKADTAEYDNLTDAQKILVDKWAAAND